MDRKTIKKKLKTVIGKSRLLKSLIISFLAFVISYLLYWALGSSLSYVGIDSNNLSYLQEYYKQRNQSDTVYYHNNKSDSIIIISIKDTTSYESLVNLIDSLLTYNAKVIGIDCIFQSNSNENDSCVDTLRGIVRKNADKIVLAQAYDNEGELFSSIFDGDTSLCYGLINSYDFVKFPFGSTINKVEYPNFAYQVAYKYDKNTVARADTSNFVINYSNIDFHGYGINNILRFSKQIKDSLINNKIILIGPFDDVSDIHSTPFTIEGKEMISGIKLHCYAINSLISPDFAMKRLSIGELENIIGFAILCWLYSLAYVFLTDKKCNWISNHETLYNILRPTLLLILVPILLYVCYCYTVNHNYIPDVVPFLISIFTINTFNDFLAQNINFKEKEHE